MNPSIIVVGAAGRMGQTLVRLVKEDDDLHLAGLVERKESITGLESPVCPVEADVRTLLRTALDGVVLVDFSSPQSSLAVAMAAAEAGIPHVIGTTGFSAQEHKTLEGLARVTPLFWSPNMSLGVNALLKLLPQLARLLGDDYDLEIMEIHHNKKKDAPSGTAIRLGECLARAKEWSFAKSARHCRDGIIGARPQQEIGIQTLRGGDVAGVHTVYFLGPGERVEITHQAHSRENFARGALRAARWMFGRKPGKLYGMEDML